MNNGDDRRFKRPGDILVFGCGTAKALISVLVDPIREYDDKAQHDKQRCAEAKPAHKQQMLRRNSAVMSIPLRFLG
ncbi:MAG: hypothetical protein A2512_13475 [Deltaproteobacteria bacterium RIFOXYD12_FULL_56_24]|nr:MAG: hypothetical protein A2512_13475 [Deltaproteobacteria bacterium RIFOXYD12_FULL_56_24]